MRAGLETLKEFYESDCFEKMDSLGELLEEKVTALIENRSDLKFTRIGSMFTLFFHSGNKLENVEDVGECDFDRFGRFFNFVLREQNSFASHAV